MRSVHLEGTSPGQHRGPDALGEWLGENDRRYKPCFIFFVPLLFLKVLFLKN